ncbi:MAG: cell surface protein SprA, partial [Prevotella sp.]|nr:cell surface protein SprA [Prevotella sp.]
MSEELAVAKKKGRANTVKRVAFLVVLSLIVAAANSSLFTFHSSLPAAAASSSPLSFHPSLPADTLNAPRWRVQKTAPQTVADADSSALDLHMPENLKLQTEYDDSLNIYKIGTKMGDAYLEVPILMNPEEFRKWSLKREMQQYFRKKDAETAAAKGKEKFDFADMHFDLGPAEKIFGPGGVRIKTQGTAELKLGATFKNIDNPSLPERNRKTKALDFDEKINLNVTGKVGDKVNMSLNYNTDATFDFDTKNLKLRYEGKEDEIIKLVEAGNVTFPSNNSLVRGASSLFGVRTDMQFGKLKLQTVFSQKKSSTKSVSSKGGTQLTPFEIDVANYEENRHFFLANYFRERYDAAMQQLPNVMTGINIHRVEVWVTNKTGTTSNTRNLIALTELAESQPRGSSQPSSLPDNSANMQYELMTTTFAGARDIDQASTVLDGSYTGGVDYEKLSSARLLTSSEYTLNAALGYISLK